jgi:hypothetical protein
MRVGVELWGILHKYMCELKYDEVMPRITFDLPGGVFIMNTNIPVDQLIMNQIVRPIEWSIKK